MMQPTGSPCPARWRHSPTRALWLVVVAAALMLSLLPPFAEDASAAAMSSNIAPSSGALFGAYVNSRGGLTQQETTARLERQLGRRLAIANQYRGWSSRTFGKEAEHVAAGRVPMISWRATDTQFDSRRAQKIARGDYDQLIRTAADNMKALRGPVLLRFAWEMDQERGARQYIGEPGDFIAAWRRVHTIFQQRGATNVEFVWAPRANSFNKGTGPNWYPGDGYVDWIGGSAVPVNSYREFTTIYDGFYRWGRTKNKPLLIWGGVRENPADAAWKARWIGSAHSTIANQWTNVKAFVYYHARSPSGNDYFADTSTRAFDAFKRMGCASHFRPGNGC